ncbi:MAG: hypothetical protein JWP61_163 [Friedmanniella sp.]|nr:hypothetical protein [Friedmanniella sp.]
MVGTFSSASGDPAPDQGSTDATFPSPDNQRRPRGQTVRSKGLSRAGGRQDVAAAGERITNARTGTSQEMSTRIRRYTITMAFRTACFLAMILVTGPFRWVLLAGAVFLPYIAVLFANQAHRRSEDIELPQGEPTEAPQLTTGDHVEVIEGDVDDESDRERVA